MGAVQLTVSARSDVGRVRTNNEDAFTVADLDTGARLDSGPAPSSFDVLQRGILLVVSDGMGGHAAGEVASALVVDSLRRSLAAPGVDTPGMQRLIDNAVKRANADVFEAARATRKAGMGATLTAVLVHHDEAYIAGVGDSRAYLLRQGRLRQITKDQSFVQLLVDAGAMTPEEAKVSSQKNVILQGMGLKDDVQVSIGRLQLRRGDRLLLCSDGLSNLVPDDELRTLVGEPDLAAACNRTIDLANQRGGHDNITAIIAALDGEGLPLPATTETLTQTFEVLQQYDPSGKTSNPAPAAAPAAAAPAPAAPVASATRPALAAAAAPSRPAWLPYVVVALVVLAAGLAVGLTR